MQLAAGLITGGNEKAQENRMVIKCIEVHLANVKIVLFQMFIVAYIIHTFMCQMSFHMFQQTKILKSFLIFSPLKA